MNCAKVEKQIVEWLRNRCFDAKLNGFVIGVSGGIDSAVVSALCAKTELTTLVVSMPIHQNPDHLQRANNHIDWLKRNFKSAYSKTIDLSTVFDVFKLTQPMLSELALVNLRSRLRMCCLYGEANTSNLFVVGTGNKVEDYGIGFFTKYGDGGVDLSPIGDLTKTEVRELAKHLGIDQEIIDAKPSDGLWNDARSDEDQIGATYEELEWAMDLYDGKMQVVCQPTEREEEVFDIYRKRHQGSAHKMSVPPVCKVDKE